MWHYTQCSQNCKQLSLLHKVEKGFTTFHLVKDKKNIFCFPFCGRKFNTLQYAKVFAKTGAPLQHVSDHRLKLWNIRDIANISCSTVNTLPLPYRFELSLPPINSVTFDKLYLFAQPAHTKLLLHHGCSLLLKGEELIPFLLLQDILTLLKSHKPRLPF